MYNSSNRKITHPDGLYLHMLHCIKNVGKPTIAYLPGMSGIAEDGFDSLLPLTEHGFNLASLSFRGRGQSSTPASGYSFQNHVDDISLFISSLDASNIVLVANSISTIYAAKYLIETKAHPVIGLIIVDHPLSIRRLREGWADDFSQITVNDKSVLLNMRRLAMDAIEAESEVVDLYVPFAELEIPTLVLAASVGKGLLSEADLLYYGRQKNTEIVMFENSDHFIRLREPGRFQEEVYRFVSGELIESF